MALIHDTITSLSISPKRFHFVGCIDSDTSPVTQSIVAMIQNYISIFVTVQRSTESESCVVNDRRCCFTVDFLKILSGYGSRKVDATNKFKINCEAITENWFDDENSDIDGNICDYSTHRLEWW